MPTTVPTPVNDLSLDLANFRTVPQTDEIAAIQAMITISPEYFWGLMESLIADEGYLPTENILVLDMGTTPTQLVVKEGNRRIAVLKLVHGLLPANTIDIPPHLKEKIRTLSPAWKMANQTVPCAIYQLSEAATVDRIVTLAHGKGDKASRDKWSAVARARHSRDVLGKSAPELDILEKYIVGGTNLSSDQAKRWAGDYPITVLEEAIKRIYPRLGASSTTDLAAQYPVIPYQSEFDTILLNIGLQNIKFGTIRAGDFATKYGIPPVVSGGGGGAGGAGGVGGGGGGGGAGGGTGGAGGAGGGTAGGTGGTGGRGRAAVAINDPRAVKQALKRFRIIGNGREKVVTLREEALSLDLETNPIAFCFLLRSMFEISAKAYCNDQAGQPGAPQATNPNGSDRRLADILQDIYSYMVALPTGRPDPARQRQLHGALIDITTPERLLSVTSMNNLVHNPRFSIRAVDISVMFGNIFPLLEDMNK